MSNTNRVVNHTYLKYALFIFLGVIIAGSLIVGAFEYNKIQEDIVEFEQKNLKKIFEKHMTTKETQLILLSSSIRAFYQGSESVTQEEFTTFLDETTKLIPQISVFVTEDERIVQAYPEQDTINKSIAVVSEQVSDNSDTPLTVTFPLIEKNQETIMIIPYSFFINPEALALSENYKIRISSYDNNEQMFYVNPRIDGKKTSNGVEFSENENNVLKFDYSMDLVNSETKENNSIHVELWDQRFNRELRQDLFSYLTLSGLSLFAVLLPILLIRSERHSSKVKQKSIELEKANKELSTIDKQKGEFSAMITHELKTPLVPIITNTKLLSKEKMLGTLNKDQIESVQTIERNANRLQRLIGDIMDARKLDLDKMKFESDDISLGSFFSSLKSHYQIIMIEREIEFTIKNELKDIHIKTDQSRLQQVFDNLIGNALKFVPDMGGKITIGATKENDHVQFYVKDNGPGIPTDKQEKLFRKFYQVDTSHTRKVQGTGLGLVICKGIIEKMGGKIRLESDGKSGTTFYFTLPL